MADKPTTHGNTLSYDGPLNICNDDAKQETVVTKDVLKTRLDEICLPYDIYNIIQKHHPSFNIWDTRFNNGIEAKKHVLRYIIATAADLDITKLQEITGACKKADYSFACLDIDKIYNAISL